MKRSGYRFMIEEVPSEFLDKFRFWIKYQGLDGILDEETISKDNYWIGRKQRRVPGADYVGKVEGNSTYNRAYDAATLFHELHHKKFINNLVKSFLGVESNFSEGLAFALEVIGFGDQDYVDELLAQSSIARGPYNHEQSWIAKNILNGYFIGGKYIIPALEDIASKACVNGSRKVLANPETFIEVFKDKLKKLDLYFATPNDYFMDAFNLPKGVAEYITRNALYESVEDAAYSLAGVKINTINAFKRITYLMYFIGEVPIEEGEKQAEKIITSNLSEVILKDISNMEDDVSIAYEIGGMDLMNYLVKNMFKSPTRISYFKRHLKGVLNCIGNEPASAKLIERWLSDEAFERALIRNGLLSVVEGIAEFSNAIAREYVINLLNYDFKCVNKKGDISEPRLPGYFIRTEVDVEDELEVWGELPRMLAEFTFDELRGHRRYASFSDMLKDFYRTYQKKKAENDKITFKEVVSQLIEEKPKAL
ncbi:hypothetical protein J7L81_05290 [Candidatus Aerophobetes bacterium]|nr:hypothetical protein [Candidatus Aerophobetes bacterium]